MPQPPYQENQKAAAILHQPGLAKVTYPNDDLAYPVVTRELTVDRADKQLAFLTADAEYPQCLLIAQPIVAQDHALVRVVRVFERIPGPQLFSSRIDPEDGSVIQEVRQTVLASPSNVGSSSGSSTITYEPRADSDVVSIKKTTTTAYDGVVRAGFTRVNLKLPRVLAGIVVSYNATGGVGDDNSTASGTATTSVRFSASARGSSSLSIIPEVFLPIRDYSDRGSDVLASVKQVFLTGALTEAALLAKLTAVYEVIVTVAAAGTYLGNSSNVNGVIWFSKESTGRNIKWANGVWSLGTDAEVLAGNYWKRTAGATAWLGNYAPQGTASGTAVVAVGRTINPPFIQSTQDVNLITAGKHAEVASNAAASKDVQLDGTSYSLSLTHGFSVSAGGNQSRIRVDPTIHGELIIAKPSYTDSVNATAAAVLPAVPGGTSTGTSSGFGGDSHAQTLRSYVLPVRRPATPFADVPQSGLYLQPNYQRSEKDAQYTGYLATIVDHAQLAEAPAEIGYSDASPTYHKAIAITANQPYFLGGTPASWSISPSIVAGLAFSTSTGVITGSPSIGLSPTVYTVTATNALGSVTATVTITVLDP